MDYSTSYMDIQLLIQRAGKVDIGKAVRFIEGVPGVKFAVVYASMRDDSKLRNFFGVLADELKVPFIAVRVSGFLASGHGYCDNGIVIAVLSGIFEVEIFHEELDLKEPMSTAQRLSPRFAGKNLCLAYSANYFRDDAKVDLIMRAVQEVNPLLQIFGGVSSPKPIVAVNGSVSECGLIVAALSGVSFDFKLESGFCFDEKHREEYVITGSDQYCVYEINGKSAVDEYSRIQRMQPYFVNMLAGLFPRSDTARLMKAVSGMNKVIYEGVLGMCIHVLGVDVGGGKAEVLFATEVNQKDDKMTIQSHKPKGTVLRRLATSHIDQLGVYERLAAAYPKSSALLFNSCQCGQFWLDFDYRALEKKLSRLSVPYVIVYVYGSLGKELSGKDLGKNLLHAGVVKALALK